MYKEKSLKLRRDDLHKDFILDIKPNKSRINVLGTKPSEISELQCSKKKEKILFDLMIQIWSIICILWFDLGALVDPTRKAKKEKSLFSLMAKTFSKIFI